MHEIGIIANSFEIFEKSQKITKDYYDLVTIVLVQNYEECVQQAEIMETKGIRILISRGGHCVRMREANISLPIIEIPTFDNQLAYRMMQAKKKYGNFAAIGSEFFLKQVRDFEDVVETNISYFKVNKWEDFNQHVETAKCMGLHAIVGGYDASRFAQKAGLESFCTFTREEEIATAIDEALKMLKRMEKDKKQNQMLNTMLNSVHEGIVLLDNAGSVVNINKQAQEMFGVDCFNTLALFLKKYSINQKIRTVLDNGLPLENEFIETSNCKYTCSIIPVMNKNVVDYVVLVLHKIDYIQEMEYKIRRKLSSHGFVANWVFDDIIGVSYVIQEAVCKAKQYSITNSNILIVGESGTGKEMFAQSIHNTSFREKEAFVAVNCTTLPSNLLESELFGYVEGAFTGAKKGGKVGLFEMAHNGTIFLDEIGEMSLPTQARFLRVLEEREIMRLGDDKLIPVNVRVIAATNKNLRQMMKKGLFREDLFYRLDVLSLRLPSLRERKEDLPLLINCFIKKLFVEYSYSQIEIDPSGMDLLMEYEWPGNIRELKNVIERLVVMYQGQVVTYEKIMSIFSGILYDEEPEQSGILKDDGLLKCKEKELIEKILKECDGNKTETSKKLGISRPTLYKKLRAMEKS
ncbi:MAG: sigma 54-interacting transcriptional regulator [Dysgonamonadaceae bacterium]|nr:sigma 54-interacting transcriptional regulator [Dysgonamonadaceae bacterium]